MLCVGLDVSQGSVVDSHRAFCLVEAFCPSTLHRYRTVFRTVVFYVLYVKVVKSTVYFHIRVVCLL